MINKQLSVFINSQLPVTHNTRLCSQYIYYVDKPKDHLYFQFDYDYKLT